LYSLGQEWQNSLRVHAQIVDNLWRNSFIGPREFSAADRSLLLFIIYYNNYTVYCNIRILESYHMEENRVKAEVFTLLP
jgi:hypothetical protein